MKIKGLACLADRGWWNAAGTRCIKTGAQTALSACTVGYAGLELSLWDISLWPLLGIALGAMVLSLLTSLAGLPEVDEEEQISGIGGTDD